MAKKFLHFNFAVSGVICVPIPPPPAPPPTPPGPVDTGGLVGGVEGAEETTGPIGRCCSEMLFVEMLGDIVGRSDIEVGGKG